MSKNPETLSSEECFKLVDTCLSGYGNSTSKAVCVRNTCLVLLMLDAGLRVGEVVRLRIGQLIVNSEPVYSLALGDDSAEKGCTRIIPLSERLRTCIGDMLKYFWPKSAKMPMDFAFHYGSVYNSLSVRQVQRIISALSLKAFGREIHPHVLRHTFASKCMRVASSSVVQALLGHKHLTSTQVYCHPNGDDLLKAIKDSQKT